MIEADQVRVDPLEQVERLQVLDDPLAHAQAIDAGVLAGIFVVGAVGVEQVDHRQRIAQAGLVVVGIVAGRDLDDAGAERRVDQERIGDDRDLAVRQGQVDVLADQVLVARRRRDERPRPCRPAWSRAGSWRCGGLRRLGEPAMGYLIVQRWPATSS